LSFLALLLPYDALTYQAMFKHPTFHLTFPGRFQTDQCAWLFLS